MELVASATTATRSRGRRSKVEQAGDMEISVLTKERSADVFTAGGAMKGTKTPDA
jgi:hypothetical protein